MTPRRVLALLAAAGLLLAACGGSSKKSTTTTTASPPTTAASTTTTTANPASTDKEAVALNASILTPAEVKAALGTDVVVYTGQGGRPTVPSGPLSLAGVVSVFPSPIYQTSLEQAKASVGANVGYADPKAMIVFDILAIKFESGTTGKTFVAAATQIATGFGGAKPADHPELKVGLLPGSLLRVPPAAGANPPTETVVGSGLYDSGVYYQIAGVAAPGTVTDAVIVKLLQAQDAKYAKIKASVAG